MKVALISGATGQDGFYLSQLLLDKGYEVHGIVRRNATQQLGNLQWMPESYMKRIKIHLGDLTDNVFIDNLVRTLKPDHLYHLGAQSNVWLSFQNPKTTYDINIGGTLNICNAVKEYSPTTKVYFAGTSELFGKAQEIPQNENTSFYPRSPYGISKLAGFWTMKNYRESYNLFMTNGILFNHESQYRSPEFVTRKVTTGVAAINAGKQECIELGNLDAKRDWSHAKDMVRGMNLMLEQSKPNDYVLSSGTTRTIRELVEEAFRVINVNIEWMGSGINEVGFDKETKEIRVKINPEFYRPADVEHLVGDYSKAKKELGWEPIISFKELIKEMVSADIKRNK